MKKEQKQEREDEQSRRPLFSGHGSRDMSVSEYEKAAEASYLIRAAIEKLARQAWHR